MRKQLQVITWARWKVVDPFSQGYYAIFTISILKPTWEYPVACVSMAIRKGNYKVFMRMAWDEVWRVFVIPEEYKGRLQAGYEQAQAEALKIQEKQKALHRMNDLAPGSQVVRTDTGEIIAEAERIVREHGSE